MSVLVGIERDSLLAAHRRAAGHLRFAWAFAQRIFLYGVVPLVVVLGSLFPEVGETLVRVVEPLRKLTWF